MTYSKQPYFENTFQGWSIFFNEKKVALWTLLQQSILGGIGHNFQNNLFNLILQQALRKLYPKQKGIFFS